MKYYNNILYDNSSTSDNMSSASDNMFTIEKYCIYSFVGDPIDGDSDEHEIIYEKYYLALSMGISTDRKIVYIYYNKESCGKPIKTYYGNHHNFFNQFIPFEPNISVKISSTCIEYRTIK